MNKKILLFILLIVLLPINTLAKDNRLYFSEIDKKLYYDSNILDKNIFMNHIDMVPGKSYHDKLLIENDSNKDYTLYFKVDVKNQSDDAMDLLENIEMKLYLDNILIYDGGVLGIDYNKTGFNLRDAIKIGNISKKSNIYLDSYTKLSEDYDNINNHEYSYVDWNFYAEYDDSVEILVPKTSMNENQIFKIIAIVVLIVAFIFFFLSKKRKKIHNKNNSKKNNKK